jgi:hypothetical protein
VPGVLVKEKLGFPIVPFACHGNKKRRFAESVETLDQKDESNKVNCAARAKDYDNFPRAPGAAR